MSMPDFISIILELSLQNKLSNSVQFVLVNLLGNVILGKRLCASKMSRNSLKSSRSLILSSVAMSVFGSHARLSLILRCVPGGSSITIRG